MFDDFIDPAITGAEPAGPKPSLQEVKDHLGALAGAFRIPLPVVLSVAQTESGFDTDQVRANPVSGRDDTSPFGPENKSYGVMQVSDEHIGQTVHDADGTPFQIGEEIKTDWKENARAGAALLAQQYQLAGLDQPFGSDEERAQQAYAGYTAGTSLRDRYLETRPDDSPAHPNDRAFLENYRNADSSTEEHAQSQPPDAQSSPVAQSPLPGPLQRLKENPGDLFVRTPADLLPRPVSEPSIGRILAAPQDASATSPARSLGQIIAQMSPSSSAPQDLPAPLQRLKEDPGDLFLRKPVVRETKPGEIDYGDSLKQGGSRNWRNNNPGNVVFSDWAKQHGAVGEDSAGFAIFPTIGEGEQAQHSLLMSPRFSGLSMEGAIKRWTSGDPPAIQDAYINSVVRSTAIDRNKRMGDLSPRGVVKTSRGNENARGLEGRGYSPEKEV